MTADITGLCRAHSFETAEDLCRRCGGEYCELCLIFPFGASKPLCKECAMTVGGVRAHTARPAMPGKDLRRKLRAFDDRRNARREHASGMPGNADDPVLTDPLAPTEQDLERISAPIPAPAMASVPDHTPHDGADFAEDLARAFNEAVPVSAPKAEEPAEDTAAPIDWSQPFG